MEKRPLTPGQKTSYSLNIKDNMQIKWTARAVERVQEQADYISVSSPAAAGKWIEKIFDTTWKILDEQPEAGRMFPFLNSKNIRELIIGSHRIIYQIAFNEECIYILTVRNCREDTTEESFLK